MILVKHVAAGVAIFAAVLALEFAGAAYLGGAWSAFTELAIIVVVVCAIVAVNAYCVAGRVWDRAAPISAGLALVVLLHMAAETRAAALACVAGGNMEEAHGAKED